MKYHIWTEGCQMNVADSQRVAAALEALGYAAEPKAEQADVIVLNTCVVRQSAEDKAIGRLTSLQAVKRKNPNVVINLMGCLVGIQDYGHLQKRFPYVDVFSPPSDPYPLVDFLTGGDRSHEDNQYDRTGAIQDEEFAYTLPDSLMGSSVSAFLPVVLGCSHDCSYCVIPLRRGREISRKPEEVLADAHRLVLQDVKEITLLGQIVDRYGMDLAERTTLSQLLKDLHGIESLERIRFLTSHPNWMHDELLDSVAELPKVMPHFELPIQAGDNEVLRRMRRGYTLEQFMLIVEKIRTKFDTVSIATDLIVGFPGETNLHFEGSVRALESIRPDMTHVARYSPRPGTYSALNMPDDVTSEEKIRRFRVIENLQEKISTEINQAYLNKDVPVLFEEKNKARWRGRTSTNKLVFVESQEDLQGQVRNVKVQWTGPWSMIGTLQT